MKPSRFIYHAPSSIDDLMALLSELDDIKLLGGGQTLGALLNFRLVMPSHLIDLNRLTELCYIKESKDKLCIGSMTRQRTIQLDPIIQTNWPLLTEALRFVGHIATRNRGTIGGSLANWDPSAELACITSLYNGKLTIKSPRESRVIDINDWGLGFMNTALPEDALLTDIELQSWPKPYGYGFIELARRFGDFAIGGAACLLRLDDLERIQDIAITVFGVDHSPIRFFSLEQQARGLKISTELIETFITQFRNCVTIGDVQADIQYRKNIIKPLINRVIATARIRFREGKNAYLGR